MLGVWAIRHDSGLPESTRWQMTFPARSAVVVDAGITETPIADSIVRRTVHQGHQFSHKALRAWAH